MNWEAINFSCSHRRKIQDRTGQDFFYFLPVQDTGKKCNLTYEFTLAKKIQLSVHAPVTWTSICYIYI